VAGSDGHDADLAARFSGDARPGIGLVEHKAVEWCAMLPGTAAGATQSRLKTETAVQSTASTSGGAWATKHLAWRRKKILCAANDSSKVARKAPKELLNPPGPFSFL